jgi:stalled ribosome rescue protein Dom34
VRLEISLRKRIRKAGMIVKRKGGYRRGYPVALLVGFEQDRAVVWQVFSHVVKPFLTLKVLGSRKDARALYDFHESVVEALRPVLREGVKSVVVVAPMRTTYNADFLNHVQKHHAYLTQSKSVGRVSFAELVGSASQLHSVAQLVKTGEFRESIAKTTSGEADNLVDALEKSLSQASSNRLVLFSLKEIEDAVYEEGKWGADAACLVLTNRYLAESCHRNRVQRLLQVSANKGVKTRVIDAETLAGKRITQFGGLVFFTNTSVRSYTD